VLRLWPETVVISLFPGICALRRGRAVLRRECAADGGLPQLLQELDAVLAELGPFNRLSRAEVYMSDSFGRVCLLPWQDKLDSPSQIQAYGRAFLETAGIAADGDWAVHAGYRQHGSPGVTAALPARLVEQVHGVLATRGLRLRTIMPVSAAAYWYHKGRRNDAATMLLMEEQGRLTALVFQRQRLVSIDVEPVIGEDDRPKLRLLNRLQLSYGLPRHIDCWSAQPSPVGLEGFKACFDESTVAPLAQARWSVV
jgi:hypothetical protein